MPLDGTDSGVNGTNYTTTFTVAANTAVVASIPDFARGPDSVDTINLPNTSSNGIPISLSNGSGVTDATFVVQYNANLLAITTAVVNPTLTGATFTETTSGAGASAQATIVFHSPTALASGAVTLGGLTATVPASAAYKSKALLHFSSVSLNGGAITAVGDDSVQVVDFLGDATGDGQYTSADSVAMSRVSAGADTGFAAFPVVDPAIIGDINGDGVLNGTDVAFLNRYLASTAEADIPNYPGLPSNIPAGPDPSVSIPANLQVQPGGLVTVPVNIDDPHPAGSTGMTQALLALTYNPAVLSVTPADIHLGTVPGVGDGLDACSR